MSTPLELLTSKFGDTITTDTAALSIAGVHPLCAAAPKDETEAAAIIHFAAAHKIPIVPYGRGNTQGAIAPPSANFLLLSSKRLSKLIHHEPGDMVATVQAGMPLLEFQSLINARGQWLPIDAPGDSTIGGIVAANTSGPRAHGYGTLRDMILGMTVINGDGIARKCGGKVVKNVTGYALDKLYIGSQGTLGLITEITFKLRPLSVDGRQWHEEFDSLAKAVSALVTIAAKNLPLEMLRLNHTQRQQPGVSGLLISAAGTDAELNRIDSELRNVAPDIDAIPFDPIHAAVQNYSRENWAYTQSFTWGATEMQLLERARERTVPGALLRFGCLPSKLNVALTTLAAHLNNPFSIGPSGGVLELSPLAEPEAARIAAALDSLNINFAFEHVTALQIQNRWGAPRPERAIMSGIKKALDPQGIMNPRRFVA